MLLDGSTTNSHSRLEYVDRPLAEQKTSVESGASQCSACIDRRSEPSISRGGPSNASKPA